MRRSLAITLTSFLLLACSAVPAPPPSAPPSAAIVAGAGGAPVVTVDPLLADPVVIGQPVTLVAHATDAVGVARLELRAGAVIVQTVTAPTPAGVPQLDAQLRWTPTTAGPTALVVIAYRADGTPSAPATLAVSVVDGTAAGGPTFPPSESSPLPPAVTVAPVAPEVTEPPAGERTPRPRRSQRPGRTAGTVTEPPAPATEPPAPATEPPAPATEPPPPPAEPPPPPPPPAALPDLIVSSFSIPSPLTGGQDESGALYVKNVGAGDAGPTSVVVYGVCANGAFQNSGLEVTALAPGGQDYVRVTVRLHAGATGCIIGANVDPFELVAESNEDNNRVERAVTVTSE